MAERGRPNPGNIGFNRQAEAAVAGLFPGQNSPLPSQEQLRYLPLRWLPDRSERRESGNPYLHYAGHEAGHILTAMSLGYNGDVSFEPDGHSIARVSLHGNVTVEDMKTIAAAGMVDTPFGGAMGYGSDKFKIQLMRHFYGGKDVSESKAAAETALQSFGPVRERFSEILAYYAAHVNPVISAGTINKIYQRALGELALEKKISHEQAEDRMMPVKPYQYDVETIITEQKGYVTVAKIRTTDKEDIIEAYRICTRCLGTNGHHPDCPVIKIKENSEKERFPHTLFSWEERLKQLTSPAIGIVGQAFGVLREKLARYP